jgi:hypothetical protein
MDSPREEDAESVGSAQSTIVDAIEQTLLYNASHSPQTKTEDENGIESLFSNI